MKKLIIELLTLILWFAIMFGTFELVRAYAQYNYIHNEPAPLNMPNPIK